MALNKQNLAIPFAVSLDTKTDPLQVMPTSMLAMTNVVFTKDKRIQKRNGFAALTSLPEGTFPTTLTTFNNNLTVIGNSVQAYDSTNSIWLDKGRFQPVKLNVIPLLRNSVGQTAIDTASIGALSLVVYSEGANWFYQVSDNITSQQLVAPIALPSGATSGRALVLGNYFIVTFVVPISSTPNLQYIAIPLTSLTTPAAPVSLSTQVSSVDAAYDSHSDGEFLYYAWDASDVGGAIRLAKMDAFFNQYTTVVVTGETADLLSITTDDTGNTAVIYLSYYDGTDVKTMAYSSLLAQLLAPTVVSTGDVVEAITSAAQNGVVSVFTQVENEYSYTPNDRSDYIQLVTCTIGGSVGTPSIIARSVGLASKAFILNGIIYVLSVYAGQYQPSYFLLDQTGAVISKLAYSNGSGYMSTQVLPSATISSNSVSLGYLITSLVVPVNKDQNAPASSPIYTQTGLNLATFDLSFKNLTTVEIAGSLQIPGGFLWMYDGTNVCENNFFIWPENLSLTTNSTGGNLEAHDYLYQVTYEWTDAAGNIHRSAPSIPTLITTSGSTSANTLTIPTLRLSYKQGVRIVIYRWSGSQQSYYQITSVTSPILNDPTVDSITYVDTVPDADILGNLLIYTTGGIVENISPPPCESLALYKSRLMLVNSEDKNQIWYSKQVIEAVPVEASDLFTLYVSPTTSLSTSSGNTSAIAPMDDKLIISKQNDFYYITGVGPDNTGSQNDFSDATFITSVVGCSNQPSIAFMPNGLMFQSNKGIWLLDRGLGSSYIGAPVEDFNANQVLSTVVVPGTNQIRFTLDNQTTLMFDYYYGRWGTFNNTDAISSTIYNGMHTFLSSRGNVYQEQEGYYQDGANPVLISFTTAWINLAGLQGFERAYMFYVIGSFKSAHQLYLTIAYDYNSSPSQQVIVTPSQVANVWGLSSPYWGQDSQWGGQDPLEQFRVFLNTQKLQSFQITLQEVYNGMLGSAPGAGLTISGLNAVVGLKKGYVPLPASQSVG